MSEDPKAQGPSGAESVSTKPETKPATKKKVTALTVETIRDASTSDIQAFAEKEVGLKFNEGTDRDYMVEQIFDALSWLRQDPTKGATHVLIKIGLGAEEGGMHPVRLGCNGRMMTVQRETEVEVPVAFYNVLQDINSLGFEVAPLDKEGKLLKNGNGNTRIPKTKYPVQVLRFINKGGEKS